MNAIDWYASGKFATIKDLNVFFKQEGQGEVLLCIHGFPSSSWDFEAIWPSLCTRFNKIALD